MKQKNNYNRTITACFTGYIVQAIVNNFVPLLFLNFQKMYQIPLSQITVLVTFNFGIQLLADLFAVGFVDRMGYRCCMVTAHILSAVGLLLLTILPEMLPSPFAGILFSVMVYAIGGGLLEVLISPVMEACPSDNKEKAMSMLHSFYCWGHVGVVLVSTIFFSVFDINRWKLLAVVWALIPIWNAVVFSKVPISHLIKEGENGMGLKQLCSTPIFWVLLLMMVSAGASEQGVSQWASAFAEQGLGISKTAGDLAGPMAFAAFMGISRAYYGKYGEHIQIDRFMIASSILCIISYLGVALMPFPFFSLVFCAVCGLSVGIMWPGTFSRAADILPKGGTAMFALLALAGDLGCSSGPALVGYISGLTGDNLKIGILAAAVFPVLLLVGIIFSKQAIKNIFEKNQKSC